ncbi:conserved hypothetical protein [Gammaproteobacteria bacterium]
MLSQTKAQRLVIQGVTARGQTFRPRDWAERLCGCMTTVGPGRRQQFSPYVYVSFLTGMKSLVIEPELREINPKGYEFLISFARDNNLKMSEESEQNGFAVAVNQ